MKDLPLSSPKGFIFFPLAWISAASLTVSVVSGIFLAFHYYYYQPLESVLKIITFVPAGKYLRSLHYFSSQIALTTLFLHLIDSLYKRFYLLKGKLSWFFLIFSFCLLLLVTFTGYLLRADETGELAGNIAENLILNLPIIGEFLNKIFFALSEAGLIRVYHWHIFLSFFLVTGIFLFHIKIRALFTWNRIGYFLILLPIPLFWEFPLRPYQGISARGPWFFIGAQEMLKNFPPQLVFLWLILIFFIFWAYSFFPKKYKFWNFAVVIYMIIYLGFSLAFFIIG
ncbi:MAG: cytochrome b N-terminal domain-containing protein [Caldimicrobium sp.]